jgi:hypothetical protein
MRAAFKHARLNRIYPPFEGKSPLCPGRLLLEKPLTPSLFGKQGHYAVLE